jgi:hypothetical protein
MNNMTKYALYHVNDQTGERVRFPAESHPADAIEAAEAAAQEIRLGVGRGTAYRSGWTVRALPDEAAADSPALPTR